LNINLVADVVVDLSYGDSGKGKITNSLLKSGEYTHCIRFGGGHNAGHTIYKDGKKFVTHAIPTGVLQNVRSIIGPGCVVSPYLLEKEVEELEQAGISVRQNLFVDKRCNVITSEHLEEDRKDDKIGTTKRGNGPAYRDKYDRKGLRFGDLKDAQFNVTDIYDEFFSGKPVVALFEGAQGFGLDIDWGDYPYVTSSTCNIGGAITNGIPPKSIRNIYGVAKSYQTYVGAKKFQPEGEIFNRIRDLGSEYGATTGRARQVDFFDIDFLIKSANINGVTNLIINKMDILRELNVWKLYNKSELFDCIDEDSFKNFIINKINRFCLSVEKIQFSYSPDDI